MPRHGSGTEIGTSSVCCCFVPVSVSGATGCSRQDQSARHGQNKMYANGLINYEISSVGYVRLLKGSTAGWSILLLFRCCSLSHSLAISFPLGLANVGQLWAANEPITTTEVAAATHYACCNRKHLPLANLHFDISNVNLHINLAQTVGQSVTHSVSQ